PKGLLDVPEVVVFRDDFGGRHHRDWHVGHVTLESYQGSSAGQAGFVEGAVITAGCDESCCLGFLLTGDDRSRSGFLSCEGLLVAAGTFGRIRPDSPPRPSVAVGVPDRLSTHLGVVDL